MLPKVAVSTLFASSIAVSPDRMPPKVRPAPAPQTGWRSAWVRRRRRASWSRQTGVERIGGMCGAVERESCQASGGERGETWQDVPHLVEGIAREGELFPWLALPPTTIPSRC